MGRPRPIRTSSRRAWPLPEVAGPIAVLALGLVSAASWGAGDFGGGLLSRRAPLLGVVFGSQFIGMLAALVIALVRGEPLPQGADVGWAVVGGVLGVVGITSLYRGLAVGRMGVVAPTTGVLAAVVPVTVGFLLEGVPSTEVVVGIGLALLAVILVTRAPGHDAATRSGIEWGLLGGLAIGGFSVCIGQLSGAGAFGPLVLVRLIEGGIVALVIVLGRQPWRMPISTLRWVLVVGLLDMAGNGAFILAAQAGALAIAATVSSLYPVGTVILAIAVLHERLTRSHAAGIVLTGVAIVLIGLGTAGS
jgi:drug/metabolite transporter (DMT)-like permease